MKIPLVAPKRLSQRQAKIWERDMSMIVRPLVIISTISNEGIPNAALKCNFMTVSALKKVAFGCFPEHDTYKNVVDTKEFVVNVPPDNIMEQAMVTAVDFPRNIDEIEKAGFTAIPSEKVKPPRIKECKLHFECKLDWYRDTIIVGDIVAASADDGLIKCRVEERQMKLAQTFLVGATKYGKVGEMKELPLRVLRRFESEIRN